MLHSAIDFCLNVRILHMACHLIYNLLYKFLPLCLPVINLLHKIIEHFRLIVLQRQIIQFFLDFRNSKSLCDRSVDIHRLSRLLLLLVRWPKLCRTHIMQTVCQLHDDHTDILGHRKKHLP